MTARVIMRHNRHDDKLDISGLNINKNAISVKLKEIFFQKCLSFNSV